MRAAAAGTASAAPAMRAATTGTASAAAVVPSAAGTAAMRAPAASRRLPRHRDSRRQSFRCHGSHRLLH